MIDDIGWDYTNLTTRIGSLKMGVQGNLNLLGFLLPSSSRLRFEVSPALYLVRTAASLSTIDTWEVVKEQPAQWHLGVGGSSQLSYRVSPHWEVGLYAGATRLSGRYDGIPAQHYKSHDFYEGGVKLTWALTKEVEKRVTRTVPEAPVALPTPAVAEPDTLPVAPVTPESEVVEAPAPAVVAPVVEEKSPLSFPVVYFAFDRSRIAKSEVAKMEQILRTLQEHPEAKVLVTGWCDSSGSDAYNRPLSLRRARAVKRWLTGRGISPDRIQVKGKGRDLKSKRASKARRSETTEIK